MAMLCSRSKALLDILHDQDVFVLNEAMLSQVVLSSCAKGVIM
jgi:hypothetical protein